MEIRLSNTRLLRHSFGISGRTFAAIVALGLSLTSPLLAQEVQLIVDISGTNTKSAAKTDSLRVIRVPASHAVATLKALKDTPGISHVEIDQRVFPAAFTDPLASDQWALTEPSVNPAGASLTDAWLPDSAQARITVAVVDTGVLPLHPDFDTLLPGYDFVSDAATGNDGDGRDNDPSDPGDWVSAQDISNGTVDSSCQIQSSTWHGTGVLGVLAAKRNNGTGIAGAAAQIDVLPIRVMGKCGGYVSDLIAGIRWAAGLQVSGAPDNANPAQVINLSLGIASACTPAIQGAIDDATQAGAVVVTAAGNHAADMNVEPHAPATCDNVITVSAAGRDGSKASYSSYGDTVDIMAPGGEPNDAVLTTEDSGTREPLNDAGYGRRYGTSIATPHVSATVAMMLAVNPLLQTDSVSNVLQSSSNAFASTCTGCGAGLLNATRAVASAAGLPSTGALTDTPKTSGSGAAFGLTLLLLIFLRGSRRFPTLSSLRRN